MRKIAIVCLMVLLSACSKHDPILPGERTAIFAQNVLNILNTNVPDLPENIPEFKVAECPYTQTPSNVILSSNDVRVFSGFPTPNTVRSNQKPVCEGEYLYAGLTTGEVVKIIPNSSKIVWIADVFKTSNLTGGASVVDIVSPLVVSGGSVYVAGLGDAFCRLNTSNGNKKWCIEIGSEHEFIVLNNVTYIVGTNGNLYAVRNSDGAVYWENPVAQPMAPKYKNKQIIVGSQKFDASSGTTL